MKFKVFLLIDEGENDLKEELIGEMTAQEIKDFKSLMKDIEETIDEGYTYDGFRYSIEEKAFYLYLA